MGAFGQAMGDIAGNIGQAITGNIETAKLIIDDYRDIKPRVPAPAGAPSLPGIPGASSAASGAAAALAGGAGAAGVIPRQSKCFDVQFNPSELTLNVVSQPQKKTDVTSRSQRRRNRQTTSKDVEETQLDMTVVLYFDDMDVNDCFTGETFGSARQLVTAGIKAVAGKKPKSVQPEVEALIGALRNPLTRCITFRWAEFVFKGQLTAVQAKYTMFSTSGHPVRAMVLLRLRHDRDDVALNSWYQDLAAAFDNNRMGKLGQMAGNVLNLNL